MPENLDNAELTPAVFAAVLEYFGDRQKARTWLATPNLALGGKCPAECSSDQIQQLIARLNHGMTA